MSPSIGRLILRIRYIIAMHIYIRFYANIAPSKGIDQRSSLSQRRSGNSERSNSEKEDKYDIFDVSNFEKFWRTHLQPGGRSRESNLRIAST